MNQDVRIVSWNVNGIRAVEKKGEMTCFMERYTPDIFLLQEVKANSGQLSRELTEHPQYLQFYHSARKAGYAGTAIWVKKSRFSQPEFFTGMPDFDDDEGRVSQVKIGNNRIFGVYFPNGGKSADAWQGKLRGGVYSWWSFRSAARSRNVGWRLDYFFVDHAFFPRVKNIAYLGEQMGSDHCPLLMEVDKL